MNNDVINVTVTVTGDHTNAGTGYTATASALTGDKADNYKLPDAKTTTFSIGKAAEYPMDDVTVSLAYTLTSVSASVAGKMPGNAGWHAGDRCDRSDLLGCPGNLYDSEHRKEEITGKR